MRTYQNIQLRTFTVQIKDARTGVVSEDTITFTKQQLQAATLVGQSSKEMIYRAYNREGFTVLDIGRAAKTEVPLDLDGLYQEAVGE